jgi:hypothetical protein
VRNGSVLDLQVVPGRVIAAVSGTDLYRVVVEIAPVPEARWRSICNDCAGEISSLVELLQGRFSKAVMERLCQQKSGLFPQPSEIGLSCTCPDWASMCKHVAAVLYGIGARLDEEPDLLFKLRGVDENELIAKAGTALPLSNKKPPKNRLLPSDGLAEIFGLEMAGGRTRGGGGEEGDERSDDEGGSVEGDDAREKGNDEEGDDESNEGGDEGKEAWIVVCRGMDGRTVLSCGMNDVLDETPRVIRPAIP